MDEFLSIALWIIATFMIVNGLVIWISTDTNAETFNLNLLNYSNSSPFNSTDISSIETTSTASCGEVLANAPQYITCSLNKITSPVLYTVSSIWKTVTVWQNLLDLIFSPLGTLGDMFLGLLIPILTIIEISAIVVILMRLAAIIRGVAGGFL